MTDMPAPDRIVSLISSATEILYALGLGERVVGVSHECDYPPQVCEKPRVTYANINSNAASGQIDDEVQQKVQAGQPLYGINEAKIAELAPDLIITQAQCDVCAIKYDEVVTAAKRIDQTGKIQIVSLNPQSLDEIFSDIYRVGEASGCKIDAEAYVSDLTRRVAEIRKKTDSLRNDERPRTALIEWIEPLMLAANWMPELLEIAGGRCKLTEAGRHSTYIEWPHVVDFDPEVIVVSPCGFDLGRTLAEVPQLAKLDRWSELTAVKTGRVYAVDGNAYFNRSGPRIVDSLEILAHVVHPGLFPPPKIANSENSWSRCPIVESAHVD